MASDSEIIRHFFLYNFKDWDISNLLVNDVSSEEKFSGYLFSNEMKKRNGQTINYREKINLMEEITKQRLFEPNKSAKDDRENDDDEDFDQQDHHEETDEDDDEEISPLVSPPLSHAAHFKINDRKLKITFIRAANSFKYPIYFVLNLKPETNLDRYSTDELQRCVELDRFDVSKLEFKFPPKKEPQLLLNQVKIKSKKFTTAATTVTGCIAAPLLHIFPYLVPLDIVVQVASKFVSEYPDWSAQFKKFIREEPDATDLDLINWLAVKIKSRFTTRAKSTLIPLDLYPDTIQSLDEISIDDIPQDKMIKKRNERKESESKKKLTTTIAPVPKPIPKKTAICPQYFDYKDAILDIHRQHKNFRAGKLAVKNLKSKKIALSMIDTIAGKYENLNSNQFDMQAPSTSANCGTKEDSSKLSSPAQSQRSKSSITCVPLSDCGGTKSVEQSKDQIPILLTSETLMSASSAENNSGGPLPEVNSVNQTKQVRVEQPIAAKSTLKRKRQDGCENSKRNTRSRSKKEDKST